jgi:hypothetical protein
MSGPYVGKKEKKSIETEAALSKLAWRHWRTKSDATCGGEKIFDAVEAATGFLAHPWFNF